MGHRLLKIRFSSKFPCLPCHKHFEIDEDIVDPSLLALTWVDLGEKSGYMGGGRDTLL